MNREDPGKRLAGTFPPGERWRARWRRMLGLLILALLLPACSAIKIAYNQAPELLYWYFDAYVDFNDVQSALARADLGRLQAWHRQTQLPGYLPLLRDAQRQVTSDITSAQACEIYGDARRKVFAVYERAEPSVALLAASFDADQLRRMERRFAKGNAEYRAEFLDGTPEAVRARRMKKAVGRAEMLYGRLDDKQIALLDRMMAQPGFDATRSYAERTRRQRDALDTFRMLAATPVPDRAVKADQAVKALMERSLTSPDAAYRDYADAFVARGCLSFSELHNSTLGAQRARAAAVLNGYEKDLAALAAQNGV